MRRRSVGGRPAAAEAPTEEPPTPHDERLTEAHAPPVELHRHVYSSEYANWLEERDAARPLTRRDSWTTNDEIAAGVVVRGGGLAEVMEATRHRDTKNVRRLVDPEILAAADRNDAQAASADRADGGSAPHPAPAVRPGPLASPARSRDVVRSSRSSAVNAESWEEPVTG